MQRLGRYELGAILGSGGSGRVQEAILTGPGGLRKPVALKILHHGSEELRREARIGGLLRHRHLVDVFEIGCVNGTWFCAMERCDGSLAEHAPLPPRAVIEVGLAVCDALRYAHEELGLVHLDLKPENLLLLDGVVKVADLGIARAEGFAHDGRIRGTRGFMAPEQARGEPVDAKADVYALAVTLLDLAGSAPTSASTTMDWASTDEEAWTATGAMQTETRTAEIQLDSKTLTLDTLDDPTERATVLASSTVTAESSSRWPGTVSAAASWLTDVVEPCLSPLPAERPTMAQFAESLRALDVDGPGLRAHLGVDERTVEVRHRPDTNLREREDAFVGRQADLDALATHLERGCLLTLKGPAGVGKSRLATVAARAWHRAHGGQAWFCDLADAHALNGLVAAVARTLDVPLGRRDPVDTLADALAGRGPLVLVLDNFEQITELGSVVARWREAAPLARLVVTSRVPLGLEEELVHELAVLPEAHATALLIARARARGAEIADDPELPALAARLDGLPLALELAAGRLGVLSVHDVLERLDLSLLRQGTDDRHSTLQAALDWSWDLLDESQRDALAQLAAFVGGFTLSAAEQVLALREGAVAVDLVEDLLSRSWLTTRQPRFAMLESVRAYALARLDDDGAAFARHGAWCAALSGAFGVQGGAERMRVLREEHLNLEAACRRAVDREDARQAVDLLEAAAENLDATGPFTTAIELAESVQSLSLAPADHARTLRILGNALRSVGRLDEATASHRAALSIHRALGDRRSEGIELGHVGAQHFAMGEPETALARYREALALHREVGNRRSEGISHGHIALALHAQGKLDEARPHYDEALTIAREVGNRRAEAIVLSQHAVLHRTQGRPSEALRQYDLALSIFRELGDRTLEGVVLGNLGILHRSQGALEAARACYDRALAIHQQVGNRRSEGIVLGSLGGLHQDRGELGEARRWQEQALAVHVDVGNKRQEGWTRLELARIDAAEGALARAHATLDAARAVIDISGDPGALATLHAVRAEIYAMEGRRTDGKAALTRAEEAAPIKHADAEAAIERARERLGRR